MKDYIHKEFPKTCDVKDFYAQVKRTVNGKPVTQDQIDMIIASIVDGLNLTKQDNLLDLGCGNGALASNFFNVINKYYGIDFSDYLIKVAKENFEQLPNYIFHLDDALNYLKSEDSPENFNKVLIYGCFSYFSSSNAIEILSILHKKFLNVTQVYIGNLPDKARVKSFYYEDINYESLLDDNTTNIGIWRNKEELYDLAKRNDWNAEIIYMPKNYYASHYRFDLKLTRI